MSESANILTPEQQARAAAINARIADLKACEGKWYAQNDGKGLPTRVLKYAGLFKNDAGQMVYTFTVETPGHSRWNPPATDFLASYHEVPAPSELSTATDLPI